MMLENFYDTGKKNGNRNRMRERKIGVKKKESGKRKAIIAHPVENENDKFINIHTFFFKINQLRSSIQHKIFVYFMKLNLFLENLW